MSSSDTLFFTLPLRLQRLIDEAFDLITDSNHQRSNDTIPQQDQMLNGISAGGFLVESHELHSNRSGTSVEDDILDRQSAQWRSSMPLGSIPSALQLLDLPPDDPEVLSVFKNAASGWSSSMMILEGSDRQEKYVNREDWRSVCSVLLESRNSKILSDDEHLPMKSGDEEFDSKGYIEPDSDSDMAGSSSDEYMEHDTSRRKRVQDQKRRFTSGPARPPLHSVSSRQKEICFKTFALFLPQVPHHKLPDSRIMIKDLQRVSQLLGEKIKAEEMIEMLSMFSASPDKSVSFNDFSRIMIIAKLA